MNLEKKLPLKDSVAQIIILEGVLQYIENIEGLLQECLRISKNGCLIKITVPHDTNPYIHSDFALKREFNYYSFEEYHPIVKRLVFKKGKLFFNYVFEPLFNFFPSFYEYIFSCFVKAWNIEIVIEVRK